MEFNFSPYMLQGDKCQFQYDHSSTITDAGYYSASGSLSPSSSIDSGCFSPPASCWLAGRLPKASGNIHSHPAKKPRTLQPTEDKRRSRSKNPGSKRETASEREKLRMRDLTKALHHLRTFLPPSVAPQGQTLTKIETLRLTINYISHLSAQLECGQEISNHETTQQIFSQGTSDRLQSGSWCLDDTQEHFQDNNQYCSSFTAFTDSTQLVDANVSFSSCDRDAQSYVFPYTRTHNTTDYSQAFYQ